MWMLTISMARWAFGALSPSSWRIRDVSPAALVGVLVAIVVAGLAWYAQPFRQRIPGGVMAVAECGQLMSEARNVALGAANETQRRVLRAAEAERDRKAAEAEEAHKKSIELAGMLKTAESSAEAMRLAGIGSPDACISVDLVRKWNHGALK